MIESHVHLAYAPRGAGLLYAVMWFAQRGDVYGWYVGMRDGVDECSYFLLPANPDGRADVLYRSLEDDVRGRWVALNRHGRGEPEDSPVPEALRPELSRLQQQFISGWLFFLGDPGTEDEARALNARGLPARHVNIQADRIGRLSTGPVIWRYDSPGTGTETLARLARLWPLDERVPG